MHVDSEQPGYTVYREKSVFTKMLESFNSMPTFRPVSIASVAIGAGEMLTAAQEMIQNDPESALYHGLVALTLAGLSRVADRFDEIIAQGLQTGVIADEASFDSSKLNMRTSYTRDEEPEVIRYYSIFDIQAPGTWHDESNDPL